MSPEERKVTQNHIAQQRQAVWAVARRLAALQDALEAVPDDPQARDLADRLARAFSQAAALATTLQFAERAASR